MMQRLIHLVRTQGLGLVALVLVFTGGAAYAATAAKNSVKSSSIKNGQVKTVDLRDGAVTSAKLGLGAVGSEHVTDGSLTGDDVTDGGLTGADIADTTVFGNDLADGTVTGADVNESTLGTVNNSNMLGGLEKSSFLSGVLYKRMTESTEGTLLGDGTRTKALACDAGDLLINGGPADISKDSDLLESTPSGGDLTVTNSWTVRIDTNGNTENYRVIIVCADQT